MALAGAFVDVSRAVAQPAPVGWIQAEPGCPITSGEIQGDGDAAQIVSCGGAGTFVFGGPYLRYDGACRIADSGSEAPALLPVEPEPRLPDSFPCSEGSCLGRSPGRPWVAVVDWPTAHGWSVAATIREAADRKVDVELYDLTAAGPLGTRVPSVSDLHVLLQLCGVAEAVKAHPADRPLAVNMSFGRRGQGSGETLEPGLGRAVGRVLSHLAAVGVLPVAAAGNHGELLFPASSPDVIATGALDLSAFQMKGEVKPSKQTPPSAAALMLGYGVFLSSAAGEDDDWPAPPGSSYAAAMLTGWLGGTLAGGGQRPGLKTGSHWSPMVTPGGVALGLDGAPLPGSGLAGPRLLLERALGAVPMARPSQPGAVLELTGPAPPMPDLPVLYADDGDSPLPGVDPCVSCSGNGVRGGELESLDAVLVDLSASQGLPPGMDLVAVFLRVGKDVYAFDTSREPALLAAMAAGDLPSLTFEGVGGIFQAGEQPSLALVVNVGGTAYWHEVPIDMLP
jgi:hypothetical protein